MRHVIAVLALCFAAPALAQPRCAPTEQLLAELTGPKFKERPFLTLTGAMGPVTLYVNLATGTWTIAVSPSASPTASCIIAVGKGIERRALPMQFLGDPA